MKLTGLPWQEAVKAGNKTGMMKYVINISLIFAAAVLACSCCLIPSGNMGDAAGPEVGMEEKEQPVELQVADHGRFTGVPENKKISSILISGQAIDVDIAGNYAYVTNDLGVLYIINISDKERPYITGKCRDIDSANIVIVKGDYAYISYTKWVSGKSDYYTDCGFKIIDISDKEDPTVIGDYDSGRNNKKSVFGLYIEGDYAYLNTSTYDDGSEFNTLEIVDISHKKSPGLVGELELEGSPANITVNGNTASINMNFYDYDADEYKDVSKLALVDVTDKKNPYIRASMEVPSNSWGIYQKGYDLYLSSHKPQDDDYNESMIQIVDISQEEPALMGSISLPGGAWELDMAGGFLYASDLTGGIYTIDVEDSKEPFIAGRLNTSGNSYDITIMGNYGYIADGFEGLVIMELSDEDGKNKYEPIRDNQENQPPHAVIDIYGDTAGGYYITGTPIFFNAVNSFDPESKDLSYKWTIDGYEYDDEQIVDIIPRDPGNFEVMLQVSDGELTDTVKHSIHIAEINKPVEDIVSHEFTVEIEYTLINNSREVLNDIECLMRVPLSYEPYQYILDLASSIPVSDIIYDNHRNKLLQFDIDEELGPGESLSVLVSLEVKVNEFDYGSINQELRYEDDDPDLYYYTRDDIFIDSDSPAIKDVASNLVQGIASPLEMAGVLYDYVVRNMYYDFERAENREYDFMSASEILEAGSGVCSDYSILYTALLRAAGIPARLAAGIPVYTMLYEPGKELDIGHAWVEVKIPGYGWVPVDITNEETFWTSNYFLDIVTERGPGYIYEHSTMDWGSYYYDGFDYSWDGEGPPAVEQEFLFRVEDVGLTDIVKD